MLKSIVGLFVGENSKKRQIGIGLALVISIVFYTGYIEIELYKALMGFVVIWTGAAFSAKITKLQKAIIEVKK